MTIPKHAFIGCLVINIRLSAEDKLIKWGWANLVDWGAAHLKGKGLRACLKGLLIGGSSVHRVSLQRNSIVNINGTMWSGEWNLMLFLALRFKM